MKELIYPKTDTFGNEIPYNSLFIEAIKKEIYTDKIYDDIVKPDMTIVDVGANIGLTVQYFYPYAKRLLAIEPSPEHFRALRQNKEENKWANVELFNLAIYDKDGEMEFALNSFNRTMNTLVVSGSPLLNYSGYTHKIKVPIKSIDTFFAEQNLDKVDFLKLDTEGAEREILLSEGFRKVAPKIDAMEVEFHVPGWEPLLDHLVNLGYSPQRYNSTGNVFIFKRSV